MNEQQQKELLYAIYDLPPKTQKEADRDFIWALLKTGCPIRNILAATEYLAVRDHPDDSYEGWDDCYDEEEDETEVFG